MPVLTAVDVVGIQRYVFGSNRFRDVLAGSWMVDYVTQCARLNQWTNVSAPSVLLAAGGNAIIEFGTIGQARSWAAYYSRWLCESAPGLEVVVVHRQYQARPLAWALRALQVDVARAKNERVAGVPQLGLSVTASCSVTGLPATSVNQGDLISPRVEQLRAHADDAKAQWADLVPSLNFPGWSADFPDEIDHMGRTYGQSSLVGVVHVDGNGVGSLIKRWLDRCIEQNTGDETVRTHYREWSSAIDAAGRAALQAAVRRVVTCIEAEDDHCVLRGTPSEHSYRLHDWRDDRVHHRREGTVLLPIRPVLLGGDDLTFLCDGRIALDLAVATLQELERHEIPHLGANGAPSTLTACAGVALVKAHAPFHRSYELADDLCQGAKRARIGLNDRAATETGCWLDWHVGAIRPGERVQQIRDRVYLHGANELTMRPYPVASTHRSQSWTWLDNELLGPSADGGKRGFRGEDCWAASRSRVKALGSVVLSGAEEVQQQVEAWRAMELGIRLPGTLDDGGYVGPRTPLLDAIELLDLHVRLESDTRRTVDHNDSMAEEVSR